MRHIHEVTTGDLAGWNLYEVVTPTQFEYQRTIISAGTEYPADLIIDIDELVPGYHSMTKRERPHILSVRDLAIAYASRSAT